LHTSAAEALATGATVRRSVRTGKKTRDGQRWALPLAHSITVCDCRRLAGLYDVTQHYVTSGSFLNTNSDRNHHD